jgi:formylmethanofuran dehydrogenase subunit E
MACKLDPECIQEAIAFHGHWCPGLAIGVRAAEWALGEMGRAADEDIVAVVETDMCAVDAIQYLTGCTLGKGNLVHRDWGKNAFTFFRRRDGKAVRLVSRPDLFGDTGQTVRDLMRKKFVSGLTADEAHALQAARTALCDRIMQADLTAVFDFREPGEPLPDAARSLPSLTCASCGEAVMETRVQQVRGRFLCIPCHRSAGPGT